MKIFFLQLFIFLFSISNLNCFTQTHSIDTSKKELFIPIEIVHIEEFPYGNDSLDSIQRVNQIYELADESPEFPGGQAEMYKFLGENIKYPNDCINKGIQGKVYVKFVVMKDGSIENVVIMKSAHHLLDAESIRVVKTMPTWTPGTIKGTPVNVYYVLPINYTLSKQLVRKSKKKKKLYKVKNRPIL
jgi:TonB family protein